MPLRLDSATALPTCPQQQQKTQRKSFKPRFKVDDAASSMPEPTRQNASRPGRHQIGTLGEIISEAWATSLRYTWARSSESAAASQVKALLRLKVLQTRSAWELDDP
jgi:hypothetical protein